MAKHMNMVGAPLWSRSLGPGPLGPPKSGAAVSHYAQSAVTTAIHKTQTQLSSNATHQLLHSRKNSVVT